MAAETIGGSALVAGDCCDCVDAEDVPGRILDRQIKESPPAHTGQHEHQM
jgi:hypothetical protein